MQSELNDVNADFFLQNFCFNTNQSLENVCIYEEREDIFPMVLKLKAFFFFFFFSRIS